MQKRFNYPILHFEMKKISSIGLPSWSGFSCIICG